MTRRAQVLVGGVAALLLAPGVAGAEEAPLDATVETSWGSRVRLSALWGKPTVLFYEDRDSGPTNQHVKDALFARGKTKGLLEAAAVIAVGNVAAYDWFPARDFVLAAVRDVERQVKVPVYLDFKGALSAPPWRLPATGSTVLVLSPGGGIVWRATGKLSAEEVAQLFAALEGQLAPREAAAP